MLDSRLVTRHPFDIETMSQTGNSTVAQRHGYSTWGHGTDAPARRIGLLRVYQAAIGRDAEAPSSGHRATACPQLSADARRHHRKCQNMPLFAAQVAHFRPTAGMLGDHAVSMAVTA